MQEIDRLVTVSKSLFDERVVQQRKEIEELKNQTLEKYYLITFAEPGSRTCDITTIQADSDDEATQKISQMKRMKELYSDLIQEGESLPSETDWIKGLIKDNEIVLTRLDSLPNRILHVDPGHQEVNVSDINS